MYIEDDLERHQDRDGEVEELLLRVVTLLRSRNHPSLISAEAHLRFQHCLSLVRELDEEIHLARCDLIIAGRRIWYLPGTIRRFGMTWSRMQVEIAWVETWRSLIMYRLLAARSYRAMRAALTLILLR